MKPDWNDAPAWANYLAMDITGEWYWYCEKPYFGGDLWGITGGEVQQAFFDEEYTEGTLEERPA